MNTNDAKEYLARREIPQLFESLLTGLMYYRPDDPIDYLEGCLKKAKELGGPEKVRWDTFVGQEKKSLPPLNGGQSRRRYDRLPPISQFSIESDSDLSETAELIEEYEVFDPSRPRPKVILVIGGPGSGKGTQSLKIAERYGFQYVSVGELLRKKMIHNATSNRKWSLIAKIITNGELAPQETTITEIKQKIMKIPDASGIVIDGFPRDVGQALSFEDQGPAGRSRFSLLEICTPDLVVFLACTNHRLKERLQKRAEQQGRPDDNPKAIDRRLTNFKQNTIPLVKYFQERGHIVTTTRSGCPLFSLIDPSECRVLAAEGIGILPSASLLQVDSGDSPPADSSLIINACYHRRKLLDADRDEEEVFCDISMTLDNKLFSSKEPAAGQMMTYYATEIRYNADSQKNILWDFIAFLRGCLCSVSKCKKTEKPTSSLVTARVGIATSEAGLAKLGPSELDLSLLGETSMADVACKYDEPGALSQQQPAGFSCAARHFVEEDEEIGYAEGTTESGPGSGKSLQCERMEERFGLRHVALGDLLCNELQSHGDRGRQLRDVLERGGTLPEDTLLELLCDAVSASVRQGKGIVICGFLRDLRRAEEYQAKMGEPDAVLLLSCCTDTMSSRLQSRNRSSFVPPAADREGALHRRVESSCSDSQAVADHYESKKLLHTIDAERPPEYVFAQICQVMENF
ncbi:Adenylate kinase isoenzyme 5 [Dissostichus eleginoides]|uniref:Adenylate kinase isoenzyme 5 n=1 Tax=Dissostichus eleginoides TaxID=100907 RepID=A0AAD9BBK9_DISEL|nr:Adenylate kinase isoenzyme 5 [Dissostichus eleginoides]